MSSRNMEDLGRGFFFAAVLWCVGLLGCEGAAPDLDAGQRELVVAEVRQRLDDYATAVTEKKLDAILNFWSDSLVFAGDGVILGGYAEWALVAEQDQEETDHCIYWTWDNVHILPLSRDAASASVEFKYGKVLVQGDTVNGYGSWTYVMKRGPDGWQVYHGNGHHLVR